MKRRGVNKNNILIIVTAFMLILLIGNPELAISSVTDGLNLWFYNVMPSLFPYMVFSSILFQLNAAYLLQRLFNKGMYKLFNISGSGMLPAVMGYLSGFPLGAKIVCDLRKEKMITQKEGYKLLGMCSTTGPAFIISIIATQMFNNMAIIPVLLIANYLGGIINGYLLQFLYKENLSINQFKKCETKSFSHILNSSIVESIQSILKIAGYMVFFNLLINYLDATNILDIFTDFFTNYLNIFHFSDTLIKGMFYGIFEITIGIDIISQARDPLFIKVAITSLVTAWSGFSIHMQSNSFLIETDLKYSQFLFGKITQTIITFIISIIAFNIFYPTALSVYKSLDIIRAFKEFSYMSFYGYSIAILMLITIALIIYRNFENR